MNTKDFQWPSNTISFGRDPTGARAGPTPEEMAELLGAERTMVVKATFAPDDPHQWVPTEESSCAPGVEFHCTRCPSKKLSIAGKGHYFYGSYYALHDIPPCNDNADEVFEHYQRRKP